MRKLPRKLLKEDGGVPEVFRFAIVGLVATAVQYGIYVVFVDAIGVKAVPSTMISYAISFCLNYILSSYFTFKKKPDAYNLAGFIISHAVNMGLQTGLVAVFKGLTGPTLALLPALAICVPINFLLVRFVFKKSAIWKKH